MKSRSISPSGFTLVELLAAMAVLLLIMAGLLRIVGSVSDTASQQARRLQSVGSARVALDTLGRDINVLVCGHGATLLFRPGSASESDALKFLCLSRPDPNSMDPRMTLVSYSVELRTDPALGEKVPVLVRGDSSVRWPQDSEDMPVDYDFREVLERSSAAENPIAAGAFRFEVLWLARDGAICREPPVEEGEAGTADGFRRVDLSEVSGFVVSVASLDRDTLPLAAATGWSRLQQAFPSPDSSPVSAGAIERWSGRLVNVEPPRVRQNVRFLQRTYLLP